MTDDASLRQVQAADPSQSTWLSANAGSGKTRVLIDRVARLLLAGTEPQRVLCLTYTKAAASEMQNRLFERLGGWAMLPEADLRASLKSLGIDGNVGAETLTNARRLFARAIETPGGLKIQTIHSFCAALLRRFPLEAQVSPNFAEMDDRAAKLLRDEIVEELSAGPDVGVVDGLATFFSGTDLSRLLNELCRNSDAFLAASNRQKLLGLFGLPDGFNLDRLMSEVFIGGERDLLGELVALLLASGAMDSKAGQKLSQANFENPDLGSLLALEETLLHGAKSTSGPFTAKIGSFPTKDLRKSAAHLMPQLEALMLRVEAARDKRLALAVVDRTWALYQFAAAFLPRYETRKAARGCLDFDDLITRAGALLSEKSVAAWVLFRLDGGIDHILVDEAQDTSPGQWRVIERLAEEFTAGAGARDKLRTIFVVGDKKQSIYSFQGADLAAFDKMRDHFQIKYAGLGHSLQRLTLEHSFRSSDAVLRVVDLTFDERVSRGLGGEFKHIAFKTHLPGRVDLWEPIPKTVDPDTGNWYDPMDLVSGDHEAVVLARKIAIEIRKMIEAGVRIETRDGLRRVHEGDFLILVQRRSDLFEEIIRACKTEGLAIAGADRLKLGAELAVKDIAVLLNFLALPEDDLSLAAALRSPLFGWSEAQLYDLAQGRGTDSYLWTALRERVSDFPETVAVLQDMRNQAEFLRPFDLIERLLTRHDGRRRLLARLGPEAEDGIDALLGQALAFEQAEVPSLTGFLVWMETDDVEVKRRLDSASKAIRVMTVHGAKGLESPIVILPDTAKRTPRMRDEVYLVEGNKPIWRPSVEESLSLTTRHRDMLQALQREENMRLLYVAMTRAESWLIVCAVGAVGTGTDSWYSMINEAADKAGAVQGSADTASFGFGVGKRVEHGCWPENDPLHQTSTEVITELPHWALTSAPIPATDLQPLSPSSLGGAKAMPGDAGLDEISAKRRGTWLHLLLEHLPNWPEDQWRRIADGLLMAGDDMALPDEVENVLAEAVAVMASPDMAMLLAPGALSEVDITASVPELGGRVVHGTIDRLLVFPDRVLAVDFKSNAVVPGSAAETPEGLLRQMGAYAAMLGQIYPDRPVQTSILWTRTGKVMPLPPDIVRAALQNTPIP